MVEINNVMTYDAGITKSDKNILRKIFKKWFAKIWHGQYNK